MENVSYIGLSKQIALKSQMDITANNIANMSTPGYKAQDMLFSEYLTQPKGGDKISQVVNRNSFRRDEQGALAQTGNPLDLALQGDGYFSVETPEGVFYTRAGNFTLSNEGEIVTSEGYKLLNKEGAPFQIPKGDSQIAIVGNGIVSTERGELGQIGVFKFENDQNLIKVGGNLYSGGELNPETADKTLVRQGMIESSNVKSIIEMNKMIEILRQYQSTQNMIKTDHDRQRNAITKLTRVT